MYLATINIPGYLPMDDEPPTFDTARGAWEYLAEIRRGEEDAALVTVDSGPSEDEPYSSTVNDLDAKAQSGLETVGTVYGDTPGYEGSHDLGLAYSVTLAIECEHDMTREKVTCGACGRSWCDRCNPTHGPRCAYEYDHPAGITE